MPTGHAWARLRIGLCLIAAGAASAAVAGCGSSTTDVGFSPTTTTTGDGARLRVTRSFTNSWTVGCDFDDCIASELRIPVTTPAAPGTVDAVLTVTLDYRTTPGDTLEVAAGYRLEEVGKPVPMRPGGFGLQSPSPRKRTTSTLTWVATGLEVGREHTFVVGWSTKSGDRATNRSTARGRKVVAVLEIWARAP